MGASRVLERKWLLDIGCGFCERLMSQSGSHVVSSLIAGFGLGAWEMRVALILQGGHLLYNGV